MSIGERISQLFSGTPAPAAAPVPQTINQNQPTPPGNIPEGASAAMAGQSGNVNAPASTPNTPAAGLDQFNDLWQPPTESPDASQNAGAFNVNPQQLMDAAKKIDFAKVIQPAQLQAITNGGEGAVAAFAQAMNAVAQTVYAQSAHATTKIVEAAITKSQENMRAELPSHIKRQNVNESLRAENPAFNHPAASPILGALQQQLSLKYPSASSAELSKMAQDYLGSFANAIQPAAKTNQETQQSAGVDWDAYINS